MTELHTLYALIGLYILLIIIYLSDIYFKMLALHKYKLKKNRNKVQRNNINITEIIY